MRGERWWVPLAFIVPGALLAWLSAAHGPALVWVVSGGWAVLIAAMLIRARRPRDDAHAVRAAVRPAVDSVGEMQNIYLGRPDLGPVTFGADGPPETELVVDPATHDPGDLTERGH